jgi:hypothetical protein
MRPEAGAPQAAPLDPARPSVPRLRRVVVEAKGWDMRARRRRAKTTAQSTAHYLFALEFLAAGQKGVLKGALYGPEGPVRRGRFLRPIDEEDRQVSVLIVPQDCWRLDLGAYVRRVMAGAERDLGRQLEWAAANHPDAAHPHAHVVLRGLSRAGHELPAADDLVRAIRRHAEQIGPEWFGVQDDTVERRDDEIFAARFTPWDFQLAELSEDSCIPFEALDGDVDLEMRVESLEKMNLAQLDVGEETDLSRSHCFLAKGWLELLLDWGDADEELDDEELDDEECTYTEDPEPSVFAAARDVLPWRATAARPRRKGDKPGRVE